MRMKRREAQRHGPRDVRELGHAGVRLDCCASCDLMSYPLLSKEVSRTTNLGHPAYRTPKGDKGPEHAGNAGASQIS